MLLGIYREQGMQELGKMLVIVGVVAVIAGLMVMLLPKLPWLGRLPGDIVIKKESFSLYAPLTTSLLLSVVLSLILWFFRR